MPTPTCIPGWSASEYVSAIVLAVLCVAGMAGAIPIIRSIGKLPHENAFARVPIVSRILALAILLVVGPLMLCVVGYLFSQLC